MISIRSTTTTYCKIRAKQCLADLLNVHSRLLIGLICLFGLLLSGSDQTQIFRAIANLSSSDPWTARDSLVFGLMFSLGTFFSVKVRQNILGGATRPIVESMPIPRLLEFIAQFNLTAIMNLFVITMAAVTFFRSGSYLTVDGINVLLNLATWLSLSISCQVFVIQKNYVHALLICLGILDFALTKSLLAPLPAITILISCFLVAATPLPKLFDTYKSLPRFGLTFINGRFIIQRSLLRRKPHLWRTRFIACLGLAGLTTLILKEGIPIQQSIYVFIFLDSWIWFTFGGFLRVIKNKQDIAQSWVRSQPRSNGAGNTMTYNSSSFSESHSC